MKRMHVYSLSAIFFLVVTCHAFASGAGPGATPDEAMKKLADGNSRYAAGTCLHAGINQERRTETADKGQKPFATILSCSDSRVPPEYIFDQGIGDLFVIRVAGNVADTDEIGSAEYGVDHLGTPVLMVLGHSKCGAVTAVATGAELHGSIPALVENIKPAVARAKKNNPAAQGDALINSAITQNVWQSIEDLLKKSALIRNRAKAREVQIVGGLYDIETGKITILGPYPQEQQLLASPEPAAGRH
jgi:carbonic anhydrase